MKAMKRRKSARTSARTQRTTGLRVRAWKSKFIEALRADPNVSRACEVAGVSRTAAYAHREKDPEFRQAWDDADEAAIDAVEAAGLKMARAGTDQSPALIKFFLTTRRRDKYQTVSRYEVTGKDGGPIEMKNLVVIDPSQCTDEELDVLIAVATRCRSGNAPGGEEAPASTR